MAGFTCSRCGEYHDGVPTGWAFDAPVPWLALSWWQRRRSVLGDEQCVILDRDFFVKGNVEIPVHDSDEPLVWTIWSSLSRENFERARRMWTNPARSEEPPYFGWFSSSLPVYPETLGLKVNVHTRDVGIRPLIEVEPTDHPLAVEQREGVTAGRVTKIAETMLHGAV